MGLGITGMEQSQHVMCGRYTEDCQTRRVSKSVMSSSTGCAQRTTMTLLRSSRGARSSHRRRDTGRVGVHIPSEVGRFRQADIKSSTSEVLRCRFSACAAERMEPRTFPARRLPPNYLISFWCVWFSSTCC